MADKTIVSGHVKEWTPSDGKKPGKGVVGGKFLVVWPTKKDDLGEPQPNPTHAFLTEAAAAGNPVRVSGFDKDDKFGPQFFVLGATDKDVDPEEATKGDAASDEAIKNRPAGGRKPFQPRDESWQAARWAVSSALDIAGPGLDLADKQTQDTITAHSQFLLGLSLDLKDFAGKLLAPKRNAGGNQSVSENDTENKDAVPF